MANAQLPENCYIKTDLGEIPLVMFDPVQLGQVVLNLLLNAAQALQRGETPGRIFVRARTHAPNRVIVEIRDTGPGMTPEVLNRITEPFFTTRTEGTGLGLSVCTAILRDHGARMTIDSIQGRGTVVRVELLQVLERALLDQFVMNASDSAF